MPEYCIMNENDINVLLDHFVGGLDSTESASVTQKINSLPLWSKTYKQVTHVFGSLHTLKEQESQQTAPEGLANKTFQRILEQQKTQHSSSQFFAQKSTESEQTVSSARSKRHFSVKPSFLALSACTGFLLVFVIASLTFNYRNPSSDPNTSFVKDNAAVNHSVNDSHNYALAGASQQSSSPLIFCTDSSSEASTPIPFSSNFVINSSEQLVDLNPSSGVTFSEPMDHTVKMNCSDNFAVFASQPDGRPIVVVQPRHLPDELKNIQNVVNPQNVNIVTPVNYQ